MMKFFLEFALCITVFPVLALAGCCNENYWCDGDPSFREQPNVVQPPNSSEVSITWNEAYLNLVKCVDYFYVQFAPANISGNATYHNFTFVPVTIERKKFLDNFEDAMQPLLSNYIAKFEADFDTDYIIKVVAVDKGAGWGELEGRAIVEAKPIFFHSRPFLATPEPPDPLQIIRESIKKKYPPEECENKHKLCKQMALEWAHDVTDHVARFALPYQDPKQLSTIDILDGDTIKRYDDGKLHHLKRFTTFVAMQENKKGSNTTTSYHLINVSLKFRLLRTSYVWQNFLTHGMLSLYHTCGIPLPIAIFNDVDLEDVEEIVPKDCIFKAVVQLSVPIHPTGEQRARVTKIIMKLKQDEFKFDVTWFTSHFHDLDQLWKSQSLEIRKKLETVLKEAFSSAIQFNRPGIWLKRKLRQLDNEILAATIKSQTKRKD